MDHGPHGETPVVLATIAERPDLSTSPLSLALDDLPPGWQMHVLSIDSGSSPLGFVHTSLEDLSLPTDALRFGLEPHDLAAIAKPRFLIHVLATTRAQEVLFIDAECLVDEFPRLSELGSAQFVEVFPELPTPLALRRTSPDAIYGPLGNPTGDLLRLRPSPEVTDALNRWQAWIEASYIAQPMRSVRELEIVFLRALPAAHPWVKWNHDQVYALWADLHPEVTTPPVVGTLGIDQIEDSRVDPSRPMAMLQLHTLEAIRDITDRIRDIPDAALATYRSGSTPSELARAIYRAVDPWGQRWPDPLDDLDGGFRSWLEQTDSRKLPRYAQALYWARRDLRESFPAKTSTVLGFTHWLKAEGIGTVDGISGSPPIPLARRLPMAAWRRLRRLLGRGEPTLGSARAPSSKRQLGVNVVGFARLESGLGEAMRATLSAIDSLGLPRAVVDTSSQFPTRQLAQVDIDIVGSPYDITIFHANPNTLLDYLDEGSLAYRLAASWAIGYFFWETDQIPREWLAALEVVDEIWVGSHFLEEAFRKETGKPITVMGLPVNPPVGISSDRERFGVGPDEFVVAFVADAYSGVERKNPVGLAEAFARAYGPDYEGVRLLIKLSNVDRFPWLRTELDRLSKEMPLTLVNDYLDRADLWRFLSSADVYASLHASEGLGLTILEAMAVGLPLVATGYGGNLDFTDAANSLLVEYDLVPAGSTHGSIYRGKGHWASPNLDQAAAHLRRLREDAGLRARIGAAGLRTVQARYSPDAYRERLRARFAEIGLV